MILPQKEGNLEREREREEREREMEMEKAEDEARERKRVMESHPTNDCCPICFGDFTFPCRSDCNHWFCASCILEYWHYREALKPCKCPLCSSNIDRLTPEASLHHSQDQEAAELLVKIQQYNRLFIGGTHGLILRTREVPFLMGRLVRDMMDPDRYDYYVYRVRSAALLLGMLCACFIPTGRISLPHLFELLSFFLFIMLQLAGMYRRSRRLQRVRELAANHP